MTIKFASTPDEMTPEWFTSLLQNAGLLGSGHVENVSLVPFGGGVMTNMVRASLSYSGTTDAPASMLVKYPSSDEGNLQIAQVTGLYELEVRFYQDIAPKLTDASIPKAYLAQIDEKSGRFNLALEDLSGITQAGEKSPPSADQCIAVFRELAGFQAAFWNSPVLAEFNWLAPQRTQQYFDAFPAALEPFLNRYATGLSAEQIELFKTVMPNAGKWVRSWQAPTALQHGEFRSANVLFGTSADAPPVTLIDFQTVRVGPPGVDLAYFMACSLPTEERRKIERDVITAYHQELVKAGVKDFDWDACWKSYCEGALYGVIFYGGVAAQVESNEHNDKLLADLIQKLANMALDLDSIKIAGLG